jgi:hypothetical protein
MRATVEKGGFTNVKDLMSSLVQTLLDNGFNKVFPASYDGSGSVILEPTINVDPMYVAPVAGQNPTSWRLAFTTAGEKVTVNAATPIQLLNDGTIAKATWAEEPANPGQIDSWIDRSQLAGIGGSVYPMSYIVSISDHGVFIGVWDQSTDEYQTELTNASPSFRWLLIQRPVLHTDGSVYTTGRAPVFCVYTVYEEGMIPRLSIEPIPSTNGGTQPIVVNGVYYKKVMAQFCRKFAVRVRKAELRVCFVHDPQLPLLFTLADVDDLSGSLLPTTIHAAFEQANHTTQNIDRGGGFLRGVQDFAAHHLPPCAARAASMAASKSPPHKVPSISCCTVNGGSCSWPFQRRSQRYRAASICDSFKQSRSCDGVIPVTL